MQQAMIALPAAVAIGGAQTAPRGDVENIIEELLTQLDLKDGDPDIEPNGDELDGNASEDDFVIQTNDGQGGCPVADPGEYAYPEWISRGRHKNPNWRGTLPHEDAEDDDPDQGRDEGEPDMRGGVRVWGWGDGPGCKISDPDYGVDDQPHDADTDTECEQMLHDVPCLRVFGIEPNPFNGERPFLGYSNLQPSFVASEAVTCAITGRVQRSARRLEVLLVEVA